MIRIGFVGAGEIARVHTANLSRIADVRLAGVADVDRERAAEFSQETGATVYPDLDAMLPEVDAIYICTPPRFHREAVIRATEAGIATFCEKPLAATVEDAEAIASAVRRSGIPFMVGFNLRFAPLHVHWKELFDSGQVGEVQAFWCTRVMWNPHPAPNWRTDPRFLCGMTVESLSHDFDLMRWIVGDAISVMGRVLNSRSDLDGYDDTMSALLTLERGGVANFHASWASHVTAHQRGLIGTQGAAVLEHGRLRWIGAGSGTEKLIELSPAEQTVSSHQKESAHFIHCLRSGQTPEVGVGDGVATVRISHAVLQSSRQNTAVACLHEA
jgi:predicted dehydrogenase